MHVAGSSLIVSATDVSGFLACRHLTTLELAKARGGPKPPKYPDPGAEVLQKRGLEHEAKILAGYRARGLTVAEPTQPTDEQRRVGDWAPCAAETVELMRAGADVIYQACLFDGRWLGRPDFLTRVDRPSDLGEWSYEVVDAKLSRSAKAGAVLQICFYSEMLEAVQGVAPERMHLALGGMHAGVDAKEGAAAVPLETFRVADFAAYYRSVKRRFLDTIDAEPQTYPEPCTHCDVCAWSSLCKKRWHHDDHFSLVAGITRKQRAALEGDEVERLEQLGERPLPPTAGLDGVSDSAYTKIREQARIQLEGRREGQPKYELLLNAEPGTGLLTLPEPSPGDLSFDIEGDPHAFGEGLEYLLGWVDAEGTFTGLWAFDPDEERRQFETFIDGVMDRLEEWPELHVYHYAAYEQTALKRLASRYATREDEVDRLLRGGVLVDLYRVVRQGLRAAVESYSIKKLEPLYLFDREVDLQSASSALANFEAWLQLGGSEGDEQERAEAQELLDEIEGYNKDDCVSTLKLRDWLEGRRPELEVLLNGKGLLEGSLPRPEAPDPTPSENTVEENERVRALFEALTAGVSEDPAERSEEEQAKWLLAQLLSWHRREKKSMWWEYFRLRDLDDDELVSEAKPLGGLCYEGEGGQVARSLIHRYRFPPQDFAIRAKDTPKDPRTGGQAGKVVAVDADARTIDLKRGKNSKVPHPTSLIPFDDLPDRILRERIWSLADDIVTNGLGGATNRSAVDLLLRRRPRSGQPEEAPLRQAGETNLEAARRIATQLDQTVLPIQGPPGSGKTYIGARMIVSLIQAGKRVGITATSHKVIVNLLNAVCEAAVEAQVEFRGVQKSEPESGCQSRFIVCTNKNEEVEELLTEGHMDLVAGTAWLWARDAMQGKLDVLVVDEAGQMSLANALVASGAAESMVLLGDPQQLEQPQKGQHPPGADVAALEHLVGADTLAADRGLFLDETWRLHPDICAFTSELYYEGLLTSRPELAQQRVDGPKPFAGAGLRFVPVEHEGNANESAEEVRVIAGLVDGLLSAEPMWVDREGKRAPLAPSDVLVVAPYNAQVVLLREGLPPGIPVGTVDKFQGQEAPIVIYSMTTSTVQDAPRGMEFLFNPNRLNVATSRARCVALVVGSPALVGTDCSSVRQMQLANGLCRLGEMAGRHDL